jgi:hypothetical protein
MGEKDGNLINFKVHFFKVFSVQKNHPPDISKNSLGKFRLRDKSASRFSKSISNSFG